MGDPGTARRNTSFFQRDAAVLLFTSCDVPLRLLIFFGGLKHQQHLDPEEGKRIPNQRN